MFLFETYLSIYVEIFYCYLNDHTSSGVSFTINNYNPDFDPN
jgi:hypothetical protein